MESIPRLKEAQVGVLFQLAGLTVTSADIGDEMDMKLYRVNEAAYNAVEREYRKLPGAQVKEQDIEFDAYEPCQFDGINIDFHGKLVWGIYFASSRDFTPEQLAPLKALCEREFAKAARAAGVPCAFAGIKAYKTYEYSEETDIEVA